MGLRGKILRSVVGAAPVCPPVSPRKGASIVKFPAHNACIFGMETPLRGRSGGHIGTAPTVSFGWIARGRLMPLGWIACKWLFCLCGIAWKILRGLVWAGLCARPCRPTRAHPSFILHAQCVHFWHGNAATRTFGRAHRHRPYAFRLGGLRVGG